ncbi:S-layer homology domain-containing protein [Paenibacillus sp. PL2-23]|uniref:S-layer homology domain-containing protein n=1 Tax=Paenibacillus sp. PL2-23 TaxID=2100729 RepID=UPI0030F61095
MIRKKWLSSLLASAVALQLLAGMLGGAGSASAATEAIAATGLPEGWSASKLYASDEVNPGAVSAAFQNRALTMQASGGKIDSAGDHVAFAYLPVSGDKDFVFTARLSSFSPNPANAWALLMAKGGLEPDSKMVATGLDLNSGNVRVRDYRRLDGTGGGSDNLGASTGPISVRMARTGDDLQFTYSLDGGSTYQSRTNYNDNKNNHYTHLNLSTLYVGFAVSSASAVFDQIKLEVDGALVFDSETVPVDENPPSAPDGLTAIPRHEAVELTWQAAAGAASYQVLGGTTSGGPYTLMGDEVSGLTATVSGLTNDTTYYWVVRAVNANGSSPYSGEVSATPSGLVVPGLYEMGGFSAYNTGGGLLAENDPAYRKVYTAQDLHEALKPGSGAKVIEIMNDLDLGWLEIPEAARTAPFSKHNDPLLHPVLLRTGVCKITVDGANGLTLFSRNGSELRHASLVFRASSNIIIRNLSFDELWEWDEATRGDFDRNDWDYISLENGTSKVWIDHCTFGKAYDGIVDAKGGSNGITISWSRFLGDDGGAAGSWVSEQIEALDRLPDKYPMYAHLLSAGLTKADIIAVSAGQKKGHLIGSSEFASDNPQLELTLHHNYYKDMMDRIPRLRGGNAHVYNIVVDNSRSRSASALITPEIAASIADAGYHFGVTSNGSISTEGGALLLENSIIRNVLYPLRNNQKEDLQASFTGKIKAVNVQYNLDGQSYTGDSDSPDSPLAPVPATPVAFSWNTDSGNLPYLYAKDELTALEDTLIGSASAGAGAGELYGEAVNWLRTSNYTGSFDGSEPDTAPTVVSGLLAVPGDGVVTLRWGSVAAASSYTLYRSDAADGTYQAIATATSHTRYTDTGLANRTAYYYKVEAANAHGAGPLSAAVSATPFQLVAPETPSDFAATSASTKIILDWNGSGADYYSVQRRTAGTGSFSVIASRVFESTYEDTSAEAGVTYEYRVIAANGAGQSGPTAALSARLVDLIQIEELRLLAEDTFDGEETGAKPAGYTVREAGGTLQVADVPGNGNKSLRLFDDRSDVVQADRAFESQSYIAAVSFDFMHEAKANSIKVMRLSSDDGAGSTSNSYAAVAIETNGGNLAFRTSSGYTPFLANYSAGTWYHIAVVANLETGKADVYVDGELALEGIGLFNRTENIALIQTFTANNNSANTYYLDNIKLYGKPLPSTEPEPVYPVILPPPASSVTAAGVEMKLSGDKTTTSDGRTLTRAMLSGAVLQEAAKKLSDDRSLLALTLDGSAEQAELDLPLNTLLDIVQSRVDRAVPPIVLQFQTALGSYELPLHAEIIAELGEQQADQTAPAPYLTLRMTQATEEQALRMEERAAQAGIRTIAPAIDFELAMGSGGDAHPIAALNGYAARSIRLPHSAATSPHATGVVYDETTGSFVGVPTLFVQDEEGTTAHMLRTGNSWYTVIQAEASFADMAGHWARSDAEVLASRLLVNGVAAGQFAPEREVTRAEFAAMLTRSLGLTGGDSAFPDVPKEAWFTNAVAAAAKHGLVTGYADGTFRPEEHITREQMAVMLARALQWVSSQAELLPILPAAATAGTNSPAANVLSPYADKDSVSEWAAEAIAAAIEGGIMQGMANGQLAPAQHATRAQAVAMLARLLRSIGYTTTEQ